MIEFTDKGLYVNQADVYIDPWRPVSKALVTHGHSDHARWGMKSYLCTHNALPVIKYRLNLGNNIQGIDWKETITINGVKFSFYPAGHIPGSAQIRVEYKGEVWVVSGDYKTEEDGFCETFEVIPCHTFITESTFGLPVFRWETQQTIINQINQWWQKNAALGRNCIISAYSLGKAQRIIAQIDSTIGPIVTHGAVENINNILRCQGYALPKTQRAEVSKAYSGALIIAPGSAIESPWSKKFGDFSSAIASGWMNMRGNRRRRGVERGFVLSDHADWDGLLKAIKETGAENIYVTHGYKHLFAKHLSEIGYNAGVVETAYSSDDLEDHSEAA